MKLRLYGNPQGAGWLGWIEAGAGSEVRALAFVKLNGEIAWDW